MAHCPSHDWDRYLDAQELPDTCPTCGKNNASEDTGNWLCEKSAPYCSEACELAAPKEMEDYTDE